MELKVPNLECMWLRIQPPRLPRPLSAIVLCTLYNPPDKCVQEQDDLCDHLVSSIDTIRCKYPDCGILISFNFNHLSINDLVTGHNLKQVVTRPSRQNSILDYIITNLKPFYYMSTEIYSSIWLCVITDRSELAIANRHQKDEISLVKNHRSRPLIGRTMFFHQ